MSFTEAIKTCFKKFIDFSGRARRSEYWFWVLFTLLVETVALLSRRKDEPRVQVTMHL